MISPFTLPPSPEAQEVAKDVIKKVHAYMRAHVESELHRCGKMFGVLVYHGERRMANGECYLVNEANEANDANRANYIAAFSAKLDGSYYHEGFVPPVYNGEWEPVGHSKAESQRLQRLLFANYHFLNGKGESKNLLEIFANEKPIVLPEEWFGNELKNERVNELKKDPLPPSGAGECCAPKLLQYALTHGLEPIALAEFWVGAPSKTEIRQEGTFYAPCSGKCVPILRHMLKGIKINDGNDENDANVDLPKPEVIYEDEWLMVVNKPSGLLSVPGKNEEPSVESLTGAKAVHRLDQDTSGLLVLAKTPEVYTALQAYFQRRDIQKRYEAVVMSERVNELTNEGLIELPLLPNPYDRPRQMVNREHGKIAMTRYVIREKLADGSLLVDFFPLTGRTHQLRVHAAHPDGLNAPIVGDRLYGGKPAERLMLHAAEITFVHPITKESMHFCVPFFTK